MESAAGMPPWLERALATPAQSRIVHVADCPIHYLRWGEGGRPGLLLIPGAGGHAHWFSAVAPLLADQFDVVAIDPAGCGDSGHRDAYSTDLVAAEIMAVAAHAGLTEADVAPILIGHSAGGQFAVRTALRHGDHLLGVIAVDALRYARLEGDPAARLADGPRPSPPPARLHPDAAAAIARFRLHPAPQVPIATPGLIDHVARHSVRETAGGWGWKFDPRLTAILAAGLDLKDRLGDLACRLAAVYGEHTHLTDATMLAQMTAATHKEAAIFVIPGSGHYPMLDSPIAFVSAIKGIATAWVADERRARRAAG